ncbi:MerR family transcriptional regulator [Oxalobacteraceae bacterium]|nr:MerR family transcriptional regulator [Oxalobacteraceae bacterium]
MYIGELARLCGVTPKAIRHYEGLGLLGVVRRAGAYRVYLARDVQLVSMIRQAQALGFKLAELGFLAGTQDDLDWARLEELIALKQAAVAAEIQRLQELGQLLAQARADIRACPDEHKLGGVGFAACA